MRLHGLIHRNSVLKLLLPIFLYMLQVAGCICIQDVGCRSRARYLLQVASCRMCTCCRLQDAVHKLYSSTQTAASLEAYDCRANTAARRVSIPSSPGRWLWKVPFFPSFFALKLACGESTTALKLPIWAVSVAGKASVQIYGAGGTHPVSRYVVQFHRKGP